MKSPNALNKSLGSTLVALAIFALAACASSQKKRDDVGTGDFAPTPYTSKQIRDALPVGSKISLRFQAQDGKVQVHEIEVTKATPEQCTMTTKITAEDGKLIEDKGESTSSWDDLRDHGKFPADKTVRSEGNITVPVGVHETWLYVVTSTDDNGKEVQTYYHFAKDLAGPPVLMTTTIDGKVVSQMTMVGRK